MNSSVAFRDPNAAEAQKGSGRSAQQLAEKELYIGEFLFQAPLLRLGKKPLRKIADSSIRKPPPQAKRRKSSRTSRRKVFIMRNDTDGSQNIQDLISARKFGEAEAAIRSRLQDKPFECRRPLSYGRDVLLQRQSCARPCQQSA